MDVKKTYTLLIISIIFLNWTCDDKEEIFQDFLSFSAKNLIPLGAGMDYHLWLVEDTTFSLVSILSPDEQGNVSFEDNEIDQQLLSTSTALAVSIEDGTADPNDLGPIIIAGDWSGGGDSLGLGHRLALGNSLRVASGQYAVISPSSSDPTDTLSGIWYYDTTFIDTFSLFIPELTDCWIYQSWLQVGDQYLNMGRFRLATGADDSDTFNGPVETFGYPGEDFVENAPPGLTFPLDVRNNKLIISIEPILDIQGTKPFFIIPLSAVVLSKPILPPLLNFLFREDMIFPGGTATR